MALPRRALLCSLPALAVASPARAATARLRPGQPSALAFNPLPQERVAFHAAGIDGAIVLPAPRVRLAGVLALADRDVAVLAVAADSADARTDLCVVALWDGGLLRIGAIDVLATQASDGAHLTTRMTANGDGSGLSLQRDAAAPRSRLAWRRESWTDYLQWQDGHGLVDRPPRPPLQGTWQHLFAEWRQRVMARLERGCADVGVLAELCRPPDLRA